LISGLIRVIILTPITTSLREWGSVGLIELRSKPIKQIRGIQSVGFFVEGLKPIGKKDFAVGKGSEGSTLEGVLVEGLVVDAADEGQEE
jgi:hypothetical protein